MNNLQDTNDKIRINEESIIDKSNLGEKIYIIE